MGRIPGSGFFNNDDEFSSGGAVNLPLDILTCPEMPDPGDIYGGFDDFSREYVDWWFKRFTPSIAISFTCDWSYDNGSDHYEIKSGSPSTGTFAPYTTLHPVGKRCLRITKPIFRVGTAEEDHLDASFPLAAPPHDDPAHIATVIRRTDDSDPTFHVDTAEDFAIQILSGFTVEITRVGAQFKLNWRATFNLTLGTPLGGGSGSPSTKLVLYTGDWADVSADLVSSGDLTSTEVSGMSSENTITSGFFDVDVNWRYYQTPPATDVTGGITVSGVAMSTTEV